MKRRVVTAVFVLLFFCALALLGGYNLHMILSGNMDQCSIDPGTVLAGLAITQVRLFSLLGIGFGGLLVFWMLFSPSYIKYKNGMRTVIPGVQTPEAAGQGQYGTARWMNEQDYKDAFYVAVLDENAALVQGLMTCGREDMEGGAGSGEEKKE